MIAMAGRISRDGSANSFNNQSIKMSALQMKMSALRMKMSHDGRGNKDKCDGAKMTIMSAVAR